MRTQVDPEDDFTVDPDPQDYQDNDDDDQGWDLEPETPEPDTLDE
jgi:hypothetical protein